MTPSTAAPPGPALPAVLVGLTEMCRLFPVAKQTVYRWRSPRGNQTEAALPDPLLTVSGTPLWELETVLEFAAGRHLKADAKVLRAIRKSQGH